jgi:hypothetical protein
MFCAGMTVQAATPVSVTVQEPWGNLFAGKETIFHTVITATEAFEGRMVWRYSADGRTLARGEGVVKAGQTAPAIGEMRFHVPVVNPGVVMQTILSVSVELAGSDKVVATLDKPIWVFPEDPFTGRTEWLKKLNIRLFDPVGTTAKLFTELKIPFTEIRGVESSSAEEGVLVVGEGVSFKDYRGLAESLIKVAAAGKPVLCLAPVGGEMQLPVSG